MTKRDPLACVLGTRLTDAKRIPLREQLVRLRDHVSRQERDLAKALTKGDAHRVRVVRAMRDEAIAKAQLVAEALAAGKTY
jgi:phosphate uptake regulator